MTTDRITVMIADDQAMVRAGFAALLDAQQGIRVIGQAENGAEAVRLARELRPDVILMDVRMPEVDGIEATRRILQPERPLPHTPRVLMLTTFDIDEYVHDALRVGASGFLLKDALPDELARAVRVIAEGDALLAPSVTRRLIEQFSPARDAGTSHAALLLNGLTERELEVLTHVGRGLSNTEIASELFIGEQTVKTHVGRLLQKLPARDRVQLVITAYDAGLVAPA